MSARARLLPLPKRKLKRKPKRNLSLVSSASRLVMLKSPVSLVPLVKVVVVDVVVVDADVVVLVVLVAVTTPMVVLLLVIVVLVDVVVVADVVDVKEEVVVELVVADAAVLAVLLAHLDPVVVSTSSLTLNSLPWANKRAHTWKQRVV